MNRLGLSRISIAGTPFRTFATTSVCSSLSFEFDLLPRYHWTLNPPVVGKSPTLLIFADASMKSPTLYVEDLEVTDVTTRSGNGIGTSDSITRDSRTSMHPLIPVR